MIIVRHGEIFTKSEPVRKAFVRILTQNVKKALPNDKIKTKRWRVFVYPKNEKKSIETLQRIFGVISFSIAEECKADMDEIKKTSEKFLLGIRGKSFAIRSQRLTKKFPLKTEEINREIGSFVQEKTKSKVNLSKPDITLGIEIYDDKAYVFTETFEGPDGLPLGSGIGSITCDYENDNDIPAAWMIMKRGISIIPIHKKLEKWAYGNKKGEILGKVTGVRDLEKFIKQEKSSKIPVFAPLIGLNDSKLRELKTKIF